MVKIFLSITLPYLLMASPANAFVMDFASPQTVVDSWGQFQALETAEHLTGVNNYKCKDGRFQEGRGYSLEERNESIDIQSVSQYVIINIVKSILYAAQKQPRDNVYTQANHTTQKGLQIKFTENGFIFLVVGLFENRGLEGFGECKLDTDSVPAS